jgi:hypothetical protein
MLRIDEALLEFRLEAVELLRRQVAVAGGVDEGAGGPGRVVEQRLVPAGRRVVDVDGGRGGLDGGEAVVVTPLVYLFSLTMNGNGSFRREAA